MKLRVISLGAGVQSTTLALMAARGDVGPMPDCAIFADTGAEPAAVYRHLAWLETQLPFPVHRVSAGDLAAEITGAMNGLNRMDARPPFFTASGGLLRRQCTQDYKIRPIERKIRELIGLAPRQRAPKVPTVEQWIGISQDEAIRMKPSRLPFIVHRWPLIELRMARRHCLAWMEERQYPRPAKSACVFCPYTDNARWRELRDTDPHAWRTACEIDRIIRPGVPGPKRPKGDGWYVHRSLKPAVWRAISGHPKAAGKRHGRAKVRQVLQQIGERVERGQYRLA